MRGTAGRTGDRAARDRGGRSRPGYGERGLPCRAFDQGRRRRLQPRRPRAFRPHLRERHGAGADRQADADRPGGQDHAARRRHPGRPRPGGPRRQASRSFPQRRDHGRADRARAPARRRCGALRRFRLHPRDGRPVRFRRPRWPGRADRLPHRLHAAARPLRQRQRDRDPPARGRAARHRDRHLRHQRGAAPRRARSRRRLSVLDDRARHRPRRGRRPRDLRFRGMGFDADDRAARLAGGAPRHAARRRRRRPAQRIIITGGERRCRSTADRRTGPGERQADAGGRPHTDGWNRRQGGRRDRAGDDPRRPRPRRPADRPRRRARDQPGDAGRARDGGGPRAGLGRGDGSRRARTADARDPGQRHGDPRPAGQIGVPAHAASRARGRSPGRQVGPPHHRGRSDRSRQDCDRAAQRSADPHDPQRHRPRARDPGGASGEWQGRGGSGQASRRSTARAAS